MPAKKVTAARNAKGLCANCNAPPREGKTTCQRCADKYKDYQKEYQKTYRRNNAIERCAKRHGIDPSLLPEFTGVCALSGLPISLGDTAHLDHILPKSKHPELATDPNNLQWLHRDVNMMKRDINPQLFLELCKKVVDFNQL